MAIKAVLSRSIRAAAEHPEKVLFLAATAATVAVGVAGSNRALAYAKPTIVGSLQLGLLRGLRRRDVLDNALLIAGTTASMAGDCVMVVEERTGERDDSNRKLVQASQAYSLAQACYSAMLLRHGARYRVDTVIPRALAMLGGTLLVATEEARLLPWVGAVGASYAGTSALAADTQESLPADVPVDEARRGLRAGGALFMLADALVVNRRFLLTGRTARAIAEGVVLSTSAAAQLLTVEGLAKLSEAAYAARGGA